MLKAILLTFVLPPGGFLSLWILGFLLRNHCKRSARFMRWLGGCLLFAASLPYVASTAIDSLQHTPVLTEIPKEAQAIVVLGGDFLPYAPEYATGRVGPLSLQRLRYAAILERGSRLPVLVSSGIIRYDGLSGARAMAECLQQDFQVETRWQEGASGTTAENARLSRQILDPEGIDTIVLVTHAWHMPRAQATFERQGFRVIPAPTAFHPPAKLRFESFLPWPGSLRDFYWASHEWAGRAYYRVLGR